MIGDRSEIRMLSLTYRLAETHVAAVLDVQLEPVTDRQPPTPGP